jgi:hypothetical protein
MITHQTEKYGWEFIFMGANIDVAKEGDKLGIRADRSVNFCASSAGVSAMYSKTLSMCDSIRTFEPGKKKEKTA